MASFESQTFLGRRVFVTRSVIVPAARRSMYRGTDSSLIARIYLVRADEAIECGGGLLVAIIIWSLR